ncbi:hypothetical protein D3C86_1779080 [compost metagenome]
MNEPATIILPLLSCAAKVAIPPLITELLKVLTTDPFEFSKARPEDAFPLKVLKLPLTTILSVVALYLIEKISSSDPAPALKV